jgi:hypothetical protein
VPGYDRTRFVFVSKLDGISFGFHLFRPASNVSLSDSCATVVVVVVVTPFFFAIGRQWIHFPPRARLSVCWALNESRRKTGNGFFGLKNENNRHTHTHNDEKEREREREPREIK